MPPKTSKLAAKLYSFVLDEVLNTLAKRFSFDVEEAKRLFQKKFITITIGGVAENDLNMETMGMVRKRGYNLNELGRFREKFQEMGIQQFEWVCLNDGLIGTEYEGKGEDAVTLVVRNGINAILNSVNGANDMEKELDKDEIIDKKVWSRKHNRVVNKIARWNNCFGPKAQEPDYENKKGRIVPYDNVPLLKQVIDWFLVMEREFGEDVNAQLFAEGNYYYNEKCGIGKHGDKERRKIMGFRLGMSAPIGYRWHIHRKGVGKTMRVMLNHGDIFIMSAKAVGYDCLKRSKLTLMHAAGAEKYMKQLDK